MMKLPALKSAKSLSDLAEILHYKPAMLAYILYFKDKTKKYKVFEIPKKYGGTRTISAPDDDLKLLQKRLAKLLADCFAEINNANNWPNNFSHGFMPGKTIVTNAKDHRNQRYVFNIDLKNFFGTINFGRVRGYFISDKSFALVPKVATIIAQIACHENVLPQGSPSSPIISNLIGHILDVHLVKLAADYGCLYTRYVDDLTFSTNKRIFAKQIAKVVTGTDHEWEPGDLLLKIIDKCGFEINESKTRMQYQDSRQEVTGLVVNKRLSVSKEYRYTVRAMLHSLFKTGSFDFIYKSKDATGRLIVNKSPGRLSQLHGMFAYIQWVDQKNELIAEQGEEAKKKSEQTGRQKLFKRFLFFKEFYSPEKPVILCEGKTDNVYLVHAIRSLVGKHPQLAQKEPNGTIKLGIRLYKYTDNSTGKILGITGGTGSLAWFMRQYASEISKYTAPRPAFPVIVLIDNDDGAKPVVDAAAELSNTKAPVCVPYFHVVSNLFVVATPLKPPQQQSSIEDFFPDTLKATLVDGKKFDSTDKKNKDKHYSKHIFAQKVVIPNADKINFSDFGSLLTNVELAIDHYKTIP